ncbi:MAG TPA: sulfatase, partial [Bryobacteraceae bacterium]|nr:sulfatase [Bryobacteraceae bacterium]
MKTEWLALAGLALLPISACRRSESPAFNRAPRDANILLITLDTTRADHLGCYSTSEVRGAKTPNLDALAARGTRFARAVAQVPLTLPSHASIMTGAYPTVHGLRDMEGFLLDPSHPTIASIAQGNGFATAAVVGARVLAKTFGLAHGFGYYDDDMGGQPDDEDLTGTVAERRAGVVTQRALDWLQSNRGKRFFLWTHYFDPHAPYDPP